MLLPARTWVMLAANLFGGALLPCLPFLWMPPGEKSAFSRLVHAQQSAWLIAAPLCLLSFTLLTKTSLGYLKLNSIAGNVRPVRWLGLRHGDNWSRQGWQLLGVITVITAVVIVLQIPVKKFALSTLPSLIIPILLLSFSNSLAEELIYRHTLVTALDGTRWHRYAPLFSGALFGAAHYFGAPGGAPGVFMAGFLGWLLAKSMQETGGFFWAWLIHFVQDVVIIGAMFLQEAGQ